MSFTTANSHFASGARDSIPFLFVTGPFGLLFGVLATEAGLNLSETMTFSVTMYAGSAQFTALQLLRDQAPVLIVIVSALAVNLRMAMYSASLTPYLGSAPLWQRAFAALFIGDQSYALSVIQYETEPGMTMPQKMAYFFGTNIINAPLWYAATLAGAVLGALAYGTYEFTNYATLARWSPGMVALDVAWGTALTGLSAWVGVMAARALS